MDDKPSDKYCVSSTPTVGTCVDWDGWFSTNKPCLICRSLVNNNFQLCVGDCMKIYSAWRSLGIVPKHLELP